MLLQNKFDLSFVMKRNYFKKSIEELCLEEIALLTIAWNDWVRRRNKEIEESYSK